jgi:3-aminobutyryl-CoA ammonia-lyase
MTAEVGTTVVHRRYVSYAEAHYAGNLVDGAWGLGLFGDVATEMCIRTDGDEGLFASYSDVQFRAPVRAGDVVEASATLTRVGRRSRELSFELRVGLGDRGVGRPGARRAAGRDHGDRHRGGPRELTRTGSLGGRGLDQIGVSSATRRVGENFETRCSPRGHRADLRFCRPARESRWLTPAPPPGEGLRVTPGRTSATCSTDAVSGHLAKMASAPHLAGRAPWSRREDTGGVKRPVDNACDPGSRPGRERSEGLPAPPVLPLRPTGASIGCSACTGWVAWSWSCRPTTSR